MENREYGAVFTRRWVVDLMLDTCGYDPQIDLAAKVAVEPSCGDGAFLLPMVERLSQSLRLHGRGLSDASEAIRAYDLQEEHVTTARSVITQQLVEDGWSRREATLVAKRWVRPQDYLLVEHPRNVDFVIGNPPYIRSEELPKDIRAQYLNNCKTMTVGADIFVGFIEASLKSLRPGGVLSFICADRWMHNNYGKKLRRFITDNYSVEVVWELHGVNAFSEEVSAYPAITQIRRAKQSQVSVAACKPTFDANAAKRLYRWQLATSSEPMRDINFRADWLPHWFQTDDIWPAASPERLAIIEHLQDHFPPLEDATTETKIGIGIATGADRTFVIHDSSMVESDRLLPLVLTDHVRTGTLAWHPTFLVNPWDEKGMLVELADFPKMQSYFESQKDKLSSRHIAKNANRSSWHRTIDKVNPSLTSKPKLLFQDMKAAIAPVYEPGGLYPHHNLYWITSNQWNLEVLGGILLSRVAEMFIRAYGVKMRGGTLRFQCQYLRKIRVPNPATIAPDVASKLADAFRSRDTESATRAALAAYGLDELPD